MMMIGTSAIWVSSSGYIGHRCIHNIDDCLYYYFKLNKIQSRGTSCCYLPVSETKKKVLITTTHNIIHICLSWDAWHMVHNITFRFECWNRQEKQKVFSGTKLATRQTAGPISLKPNIDQQKKREKQPWSKLKFDHLLHVALDFSFTLHMNICLS